MQTRTRTPLLAALIMTGLASGCANQPTQVPARSAATPPPQATLTAAAPPPIEGPESARPGECYVRVFTPAAYRTEDAKVVMQPGGERVEIIPPRYVEAEEQVLIKPATTQIELVPAEYETVEEQVLVRPATVRYEPVPPVYETVTERVMVKPALQVWRKGTSGVAGAPQRVDPQTGEIYCLVETPAEYREVSRRVMTTPATTREVQVPAEYRTVTRQILKTPATTREVQVPAEYATVKVSRLETPAREERIPIAPEEVSVQRTVLDAPAKTDWRQVVCEANLTADQITKLQTALRAAGFDPGEITGRLTQATLDAVNAYQQAHDLPVDRGLYINIATAESLLGTDMPTTVSGN